MRWVVSCRRDAALLMEPILDAKLTSSPQCLANNVLITRLKVAPPTLGASARDTPEWQPRPAFKVLVTIGLTRKETERAGVVIRNAVAKVIARRK